MEIKDAEQEISPFERTRFRRWQIATVSILYFGYIGILLNRRYVGFVLPAMRNDSSLVFDPQTPGIIFAAGNAAHLAGGLFSGAIIDRVGGRIVFSIITLVPALATVGFSFSRSLAPWAICLAISRFFQAACSPAITKLASVWFPPSQYSFVSGFLSSSTRVGAITGALAIGAMLGSGLRWDVTLWAVAGILLLGNVFSWVFLRTGPEAYGFVSALLVVDAPKEPHATVETTLPRPQELNDLVAVAVPVTMPPVTEWGDIDLAPTVPQPLRVTLLRFARTPRFWLVCLYTAGIWMLFEFDVYIPMYVSQVLRVDPQTSSLLAAPHPAGMLIAMTAGGALLDRISRRSAALVIFCSALCACVCVAVFWMMTATGITTIAAAACVSFVFGLSLGLPAYLPSSLFALRFGGKLQCATLQSSIEVVGFCSVFIFNLVSSYLTNENGNWTPLFIFMTCMGLLAVTLLGVFQALDVRAAARMDVLVAMNGGKPLLFEALEKQSTDTQTLSPVPSLKQDSLLSEALPQENKDAVTVAAAEQQADVTPPPSLHSFASHERLLPACVDDHNDAAGVYVGDIELAHDIQRSAKFTTTTTAAAVAAASPVESADVGNDM